MKKNRIKISLLLSMALIAITTIITPYKAKAAGEQCADILASSSEWKISGTLLSNGSTLANNLRHYNQSIITFVAPDIVYLSKSVSDTAVATAINSYINESTITGPTDKYQPAVEMKTAYQSLQSYLRSNCSSSAPNDLTKIDQIVASINKAIQNVQASPERQMSITADASVVKGNTSPMKLNFSGFQSTDKFTLYISNLKTGCSSNQEQTSCWDLKASATITKNTVDFTWDTKEAGTIAGQHTIRLKAFTSAGVLLNTGERTIQVCATETECAAAATEQPAETAATGKVTLPTTKNFVDGKSLISLAGIKASLSTPSKIIDTVIGVWFPMLLGIAAFIGIIVGGFLMITSGGDPTKAEKGKKAVLYSAIGIILATSTYVIMKLVVNIINTGIQK